MPINKIVLINEILNNYAIVSKNNKCFYKKTLH